MAWDPAVLFPAAAATGMLKSAIVTPANGSPLSPVWVNFETPDQMFQLQDVKVHSSEYAIEYQTADLPTLAKDDSVAIDSINYLVREPPSKQGDGFFSKVLLTKVTA